MIEPRIHDIVIVEKVEDNKQRNVHIYKKTSQTHENLRKEIRRLWNVKTVEVTPAVISAILTVTPKLVNVIYPPPYEREV